MRGIVMGLTSLSEAVDYFAQRTAGFDEAALNDEGWQWHGYEQVRYAFLETMLELRQIAVDLAAARIQQNQPPTLAQRVLAQHQRAYRDLLALFIGITEADFDRLPAPKEWPLREVLIHATITERGFMHVIEHALAEHRRGVTDLTPRPSEAMDYLNHAEVQAIFDGSMAGNLTYYRQSHAEVQSAFLALSDSELDIPSLWWEGELFPLRFRLQRFEIHLAEHINQAEKTRLGIGRPLTEAEQLLRQTYEALAEVEGVLIGFEAAGGDPLQALAQSLIDRANNVADFVANRVTDE
jgi:hypothetical protein